MAVTISAVVIAKNEELNIRRCLAAVSDLVDEIIVVDSFSTDKTESICKEFEKVRFQTHPWAGYSATKNYANSLASSDYVLSLDADEELSTELRAYLSKLKAELKPTAMVAYAVDRLTNYCGQWIWHSGWRPDYQIRLFQTDQAEWDGAEVHETIRVKPGVRVEKIDQAPLYHYSYYSIADHVERVNKYSSLGAEKIVRKKKRGLVLRAVVNSLARFFKAYVLKLGFLDGFYGFVIAVISAYAVFLKYAKARQLLKAKNPLKAH